MEKTLSSLLSALLVSGATLHAETSLKDVLAKIEPPTAKPTDTTTAFTVAGVVSARTVLKDGSLAFFLHQDDAGLPVVFKGEAAKLPRYRERVEVTGKLTRTPDGITGLLVAADGLALKGTNQGLPPIEVVSWEALGDAAALAKFEGRHVVVTNVAWDNAGKFEPQPVYQLKAGNGKTVAAQPHPNLHGRVAPAGLVNVFGTVARWQPEGAKGPEFRVVPARFIGANSAAMRELATKHTCITCHNPDVKLIGPAYKDVAAKYKDDPDAIAKMIDQMEKGGQGKWGIVPMMPFKGRVTPDEMKQLATWIYEMRWEAVLNR
jgi:cytochrome c